MTEDIVKKMQEYLATATKEQLAEDYEEIVNNHEGPTVDEYFKSLQKGWPNLTIMWIARESDGSLWLYSTKPEWVISTWGNKDKIIECIPLDSELFPEVTLENSPQEVEISLKKLT